MQEEDRGIRFTLAEPDSDETALYPPQGQDPIKRKGVRLWNVWVPALTLAFLFEYWLGTRIVAANASHPSIGHGVLIFLLSIPLLFALVRLSRRHPLDFWVAVATGFALVGLFR